MARKFTTLAFLLIMASGCALLLWRLAGETALAHKLRQASWLDGGVTQVLDQHIGLALPADKTAGRWINGLLYAATGDADPQVRSACPGWLFLTEEIVETPQGERHLAQRIALAHKLLDALHRRGIAVIAAPVPDKVEQTGAALCGLAISSQARQRRQAWRQASAGLPLLQVDLSTGWVAPGYWRTDSHWDRDGAAFAAGRIADAIAAAQLPTPAQPTAMRLTTDATTHARSGDLMRLAGIDRNQPPFAPPADTDRDATLQIEHSGGLLDDVAAPAVMLAGSSYSLNSGFIDYLQLQMKQEIVQQSRLGSGFAGSLLDLLQHPARLDGIRLLIWEWPLRVLYQPLTKDEQAYLQQ
ncbi:hypothetical protein [Herbaspirillum sp. RV1423]|uniref:alginate O-acetyltransferase AlgX-related protein n=1 Tax=Herbaspirillum sp. RV1423 TaxID=1443993 RepID=UPI0004B5E480|nr:hypothetical protein [Herbaspirillum sp. RV1423]